MDISNTEPIFMNYEEFFVDRVYDVLPLENQDVVLDIGANVGLWTKYILSKGAGKVYCKRIDHRIIEINFIFIIDQIIIRDY